MLHVDIGVSSWSVDAGDPSRNSLDSIASAADYLPTLERRLAAIDTSSLDLCTYNAGMDPHEDCDIGGLDGMTTDVIREREQMVFDWAARAAVPVAFVLAGGYSGASLSRDALVDLHRLTIAAAAERPAVMRRGVPEPLVVRMGVLSRKEFESVTGQVRGHCPRGRAAANDGSRVFP